MINYLWAIIIIGAFIISFFTGKADLLADAALNSAKDAAMLCINMVGAYALWMGILNIAKESGLVDKIAKKLGFIIRKLFTGVKNNTRAISMIALNLSANILGMGNAATPFGIKAIEEMQKGNPDKKTATDDMCMLLVINASSVQLLPLSIIALRSATGSANPADIVVSTLITTVITTATGITAVKIIQKFGRKRSRRAKR